MPRHARRSARSRRYFKASAFLSANFLWGRSRCEFAPQAMGARWVQDAKMWVAPDGQADLLERWVRPLFSSRLLLRQKVRSLPLLRRLGRIDAVASRPRMTRGCIRSGCASQGPDNKSVQRPQDSQRKPAPVPQKHPGVPPPPQPFRRPTLRAATRRSPRPFLHTHSDSKRVFPFLHPFCEPKLRVVGTTRR